MCLLHIGATELQAILMSIFLLLFWCVADMQNQRLLFSLAVALIQAAGWKGLSSALLTKGTLHVLCCGAAVCCASESCK